MSNASLYYSYWRRALNLNARRQEMEINNSNLFVPVNSVPNIHADIQINQTLKEDVNSTISHADNNTMDDNKTGRIDVYA